MAARKAAGLPMPSRGTKLALGFGLVNVPVAMKPLAETQRPVAGKGLCPEHGPNLSQQMACCVGTPDEHVLGAGEKVMGYPHPDDPKRYVVVDPAILDELDEEHSGQAAIERMVDVTTIDPAYFDRSYVVWPQPGGEAAFDLLAAVLHQEQRAAVVTAVLTKKTRTIIFRWSEELECVLAHVVQYDSMLRHEEVALVRNAAQSRPEPDAKLVAAAKTLLATLEGTFDASEVADTYTPQLEAAIRAADKGETFTPVAAAESAPVLDLMAALAASVDAAGEKPKAKRTRKAAA